MIVNYLPVLMYLYVTAIMDFKHLTVQSVRNFSLVITVRDVRQTILDTTLHALNSASMDSQQKQVSWPALKILILSIPHHFKNCGILCYTPIFIPRRSRRDIVLASSVRPSVRPEPYLSTYWSDLIHSWYK